MRGRESGSKEGVRSISLEAGSGEGVRAVRDGEIDGWGAVME